MSTALNRMIRRIASDKRILQKNLSALAKANEDLKRAQQEIVNAEKLASVGRLSAGIAHEIGNPIAIIIGYLDLIRDPDSTDEEKADFIQRTEKEINRIHKIIRQLLDFSRPSGEFTRSVLVHQSIEEIIEIVGIQPFMTDIELESGFQAFSDNVQADPDQLKQVFLNLLMNAADAIAESPRADDGKIHISTEIDEAEDKDNFIRVVFQDNGSGISSDQINLIFDPFYTSKSPGKRHGAGIISLLHHHRGNGRHNSGRKY